MSDEIRRRALSGIFWAMLQNWSIRALSFVLFLILARILTPAEFGLAAAINVVMIFVALIAEQGFGDAIVQRRELRDEDINLPFFSSLVMSGLLAIAVAALSGHIEEWINVPGLAPLLTVAAVTLPLTSLWIIQEAIYRRQLLYRRIAIRMLVTASLAGAVAIGCAYAGLGSWSLVIQSVTMSGLNVLWLWYRPLWRPSRSFNVAAYKQIVRFSGSILAARVFDAIGTRTVEFLIVGLYGAAGLGLYAVGSRVFQTAMQLMSSAITNVSLSTLSRVADDLPRMRRAFLRTQTASAALAMPAFVAGAVVSREFVDAMFGDRWADSGDVMHVLMLLGAVQSVQFVNGPTFNALGRPHYLAWMTLLKAITAVTALLLIPTSSVIELTIVFAGSQLIATPVTYALLMRCLELDVVAILRQIVPFHLAAAVAYLAVNLVKRTGSAADLHAFALLFAMLAVFAAVYALLALTLGHRQVREIWHTVSS